MIAFFDIFLNKENIKFSLPVHFFVEFLSEINHFFRIIQPNLLYTTLLEKKNGNMLVDSHISTPQE